MKILKFTVEEINLIAIYKADTKIDTMVNIMDAYPYMMREMQEIATGAAQNLSTLSEDEFAGIVFAPADDE